jgi:hypothetical protein
MKQKPKSKKPTRHKPFNPWVYKNFDMTGGNNEPGRDPERKAHK